MVIGVPREIRPGEFRVGLVPESVKKLVGAGLEVRVEKGAGVGAYFPDEQYVAAGATLVDGAGALYGASDFVLKVQPPTVDEAAQLKPGAILLAGLLPTKNLDVVKALQAQGVTAFSTDAIPRTTRAQAMDTLSSMANIAGYRGVLLAAAESPRYFPMLMTAAGTVFAAKVFVIGAGVAGLQAIATARRLGAQITATDVRPEVKEQIESVGAKYVGVELKESAQAGGGYAKQLSAEDQERQRAMLAEACAGADVVITTALVGGVFAPKLLTAEVVRRMKPGSVVVDLAADGGGNCELSKPGHTVVENGVKILAPTNVAAGMPFHASTLWSRNATAFVQAFWKKDEKTFALDFADDILAGAVVTHGGDVKHAATLKALSAT